MRLDIGLGAKGGVNVGGANIETNVDSELRNQPMVAGMLEFGVHRPLSLALEPMYAVEGARFTIGDFEGSADIGYFELPILLKGNLVFRGADERGRIFAFAGPNLAWNTTADGNLPGGETLSTEDIQDFEFLGDIGLGGGWRFARNWHLTGDVRYTFGFSDILEETAPVFDEWSPRGVKAAAGILYHLPG